MLRFLSIKRLAVIDAVEVEFDPGLNVLTGETGAGKSILVEAVGLLLGGRASGDLVRSGEEQATIEAIFESAGEEIHVRREISAQGRSRAFINGDLATAGALKDLSGRLIQLHGQHEHHTLLDPSTHIRVLDEFGGLATLVATVGEAFETMRAARDELERIQRRAAERGARLDLASFQLSELDKADVAIGEDERLVALRQVLANAERVERLCAESHALLYEDDGAVLSALGGVWKRVADLAVLDARFQGYLEARDGIKAQLGDLSDFLRRYKDGIDASPERLHEVEGRLARLEQLKRKYGPTLADVIARRADLGQEVGELMHADERLAELQRRYDDWRAAYVSACGALSAARKGVARDFPRQLEKVLAEVAMDRTAFEVRFDEPLGEASWTAQGFDQAEFHVSPNPGEELRPLARIASGGELSRIMLAIKTLSVEGPSGGLSDGARMPSGAAPGLVFDEVDAGIGGRAADVVGRKLRALGSAFQVLCITHLPQIAAYADTHFAIEKRIEGGRTLATVRRLKDEARVEELSRMLGGAVVTDAVRASAREMLAGRAPVAAGGRIGRDVRSPSSPRQTGQAKAKGERRKSPGER